MRLIGILQNENEARRISAHLKRKGIDNHCDASFDAQTGAMSYHLWAIDEDRIGEAEQEFRIFSERPADAAYDAPITETFDAPPAMAETLVLSRQARTPFTAFIIALCSLIFILNFFEEKPLLPFTSIQSALLFDWPASVADYLETLRTMPPIPPGSKLEAARQTIETGFSNLVYWKGAYDWVLLKITGQSAAAAEGPLFEKIRQGEAWRLISPVIVHRDLLHILFNMIWVWVLSRPIEQRIGMARLVALSLICGVGSNMAQYLMSGPFFIGYSGIVTGLAGFTWMREKIAPWEGYPLNRGTVLFLLLFIAGMFLLQFSSFLLQWLMKIEFEPNIANTAHIAGALFGVILARFSFFAERIRR